MAEKEKKGGGGGQRGRNKQITPGKDLNLLLSGDLNRWQKEYAWQAVLRKNLKEKSSFKQTAGNMLETTIL